MQHDEAIRTHAAERYVLDEMSAEERELYEEHYFSCERCAQELSAARAFADNARVALSSSPEIRDGRARAIEQYMAPHREPWWRRILVAPPRGLIPALGSAVVLLIGTAAYQQFSVIPQLRGQLHERNQPHAVPAVALRSAARGGVPRLVVDASQPYAVLQADLVASREVSGYRATLLDTQERQLFEARVAAPEPGMPVTLLVPARELDPGDYTLVFREDDQAAREAGRFVFTLERR